MAPRTIDVVVTANVRRGASLTARAKKYDALIAYGLKPGEINAIPEGLFNEMSLECETPEELPSVDEDLVKSLIDEGVVTNQSEFEAAVVKVLRKYIDHEIRVRGGNLFARGPR